MSRLLKILICLACGYFIPTLLAAQVVTHYSVDTIRRFSPGCDSVPGVAYFQVKGKYPESSATLVRWADSAVRNLTLHGLEDGYITFRVLIDCSGKMAAIKVLQTDERYRPTIFSDILVQALYAFTKSLDQWQARKVQGKPVNYSAYLSYKIENNHVVQVSP